jgi:peptidoglycan/xylan/chitin deacetylase (PgdA/CDA1 family)
LARRKQRDTLTVAMFHRVLDPADQDFTQRDPDFALSAALFEQLLGFFRDHYAVVSLRDVMDARDGSTPLPAHALLISFDDGWADNLRNAAPLLRARRMPAVVFAVPEAIQSSDDAWWQEQIFAAARARELDAWLDGGGRRAMILREDAGSGLPHPLDIVTRLLLMERGKRAEILATLPTVRACTRMMLRPDEVPRLAAYGLDVGLHGYSHAPLTALSDVEDELSRAKQAVAMLAGGTATTTVLGCPHGRYDSEVLAAARAAGMKLVFTSDPHLNRTKDGMLVGERPLGRINIVARQIEAAPDHLSAAAAARWLWARDCE